jgi:hypothetical protein
MQKTPMVQTRRIMEDDGIAIDSPDAPTENSDAGDSAGLYESYKAMQIRRYRTQANQFLRDAKRLVGHDRDGAEKAARRAINAIVHAFWWAEGTEMEEPQHALMHRIGRWTRKNFGCSLEFGEEGYFRTCPLDIAHTRVGMSIGFIANRICSLCGDDLSECPHRLGRTYWVRGGAEGSRKCRVCREESCRHKPDRLYRAQVIAIVESGEIREVSLVRRPANPEARLLKIGVPAKDLTATFGTSFVYGMDVSCNKCLDDCPGFIDFGEESEDSMKAAAREQAQ